MKLHIKLHPNSSQEKIVKNSEEEYGVWIKEKPIDGKANSALEKFLRREWKKEVKIVSGFTSRVKIVEVAK